MQVSMDLYMSTIMFSVVAAVIAVCLLVALIYVPEVSKYSYAILTLEVGLLCVIVYAVIELYRYEKTIQQFNRNISTTILSTSSCPLFYTLGSNQMCVNSNVTPTHVYSFLNPGDATNLPNISLKDFDKKNARDACKTLYGVHSNVPWVDLRTKCEGL